MAILVAQPYELPPTGIHGAKFTGTDQRKSETSGKEFLLWESLIERPEGNPIKVTAPSSLHSCRETKVRTWAEILAYRRFCHKDARVGIDTDTLIGGTCTLVIGHEAKSDGRMFAHIENILPAKFP